MFGLRIPIGQESFDTLYSGSIHQTDHQTNYSR